jgi:hypothetical protein
MTEEEAIALWKEQNPQPITVHENGEEREITDEEYEAMAADRGPMLIQQAEQQEAAAATAALNAEILAAQPTLEAYAAQLLSSSGSMPVPETQPAGGQDMVNMPELQKMVSDTMLLLSGLVDLLVARGIVTPGEVGLTKEKT